MSWRAFLALTLLSVCAAQNQTLLVTRADGGATTNGTAELPPELPPEFFPPVILVRIGIELYVVESNETVEDLCDILKDVDPTISTCEGDAVTSIDQVQATDDTYIAQQSNLVVTNIESAWSKGYVGDARVKVCIVDTGSPIGHPDFGANLFVNAAESGSAPGQDADGNGCPNDINGCSFLNGVASGDVADTNSHGSWTTGAVGATTNNNIGIASVPQTVTVIPCRYLDATGNGQISDALRCWEYCIGQGAAIISNSWGASNHVVAMDTAVAAVTSSGALMTCSAGNGGVSVDRTPQYPSQYAATNKQVISVAASDANNNLWIESNYGLQGGVTLAAPGVGLLGLGLAGTYIKDTGTSMSTPIIAGVAVLQYAAALKAGISINGNANLAQAAKTAMATTTTPFATVATHTIPTGIVNAVSAVEALDIASLQAIQKQNTATATASVGVSVAIAVVAFCVGGVVVALAMTIAFKRREILRQDATNP